MFGLEDEKTKKLFEFDLEKQIKKSYKEQKKICDRISQKLNQLKTIIREGESSENFDQYVSFCQAYTALERIIKKISKSETKQK